MSYPPSGSGDPVQRPDSSGAQPVDPDPSAPSPYQPPQQGYPQQGYPQQGYPQQGQPQQNYPQQAYPGQPPVAPLSQSDERLWATLAHAGIIVTGFVAPLIVYVLFKDRSAWLKESSREALNFSILVTAASVLGAILTIVIVGFVLLLLVGIATLVFCILAAIASNKGELYTYPVNWRIVK